ncbi:MAG: translation initiation factor IF-2 subunit alpha [Sulfolobaceae archaeon]
MIYKKQELPEVGEVVIATVKQIFDYGAYVTLDEYRNLQAFLPWSEISSKWVRNIRDLLRENMKVVAKVIRVDKRKGNVDVSLKKVTEDEKRKKMLQWKRLQKIDKLIEIIAQKLNKKEEEVWANIIWKLEDKYGDFYSPLERAAKEGSKILLDAGVNEEYIKILLEEVSKHIEEKKIKVSGLVSLRTTEPKGVVKIRQVFDSALEEIHKLYEGSDEIYNIKIYTVGAPRYRIDVTAGDPKFASQVLQDLINSIKQLAQKDNIEFLVITGSKK